MSFVEFDLNGDLNAEEESSEIQDHRGVIHGRLAGKVVVITGVASGIGAAARR